jgi:hypothetical protein
VAFDYAETLKAIRSDIANQRNTALFHMVQLPQPVVQVKVQPQVDAEERKRLKSERMRKMQEARRDMNVSATRCA